MRNCCESNKILKPSISGQPTHTNTNTPTRTSGCRRDTGRLNSARSGTLQNRNMSASKFSHSAGFMGGARSASSSSVRT